MRLPPLRPLLLALGATLGACFDLSEGDPPELATHVSDWREEIIYQVLVDRFANGDRSNDVNVREDAPARYHGGDWRGLEERLDYIEALGVTTLWISPVVKNVETDAGVDGYHGYWAQDLTKTNPHFGDLAALRRLVRAAHARGIRVIVDIVTNHMGQLFYYDINQNGQPDVQLAESGDKANPSGVTTKPVVHITEYDPDFDPRGIQAMTSLGESGPAPIVFVYDAAANKVPALPEIFQLASSYNRRGRVVDYEHASGERCKRDSFLTCDQCPGEKCLPWFDQTELGDFPGGLKDINTRDPAVRAALIDAYAKWVEETDIDGFRIDTLKHVEHGFWMTFAPAVRERLAKKGKLNFLMFGESFDGNDAKNGEYTKDGELDSVFYFSQKFQVFDDVFKRRGPTTKVRELWAQRPVNYGTEAHPNAVGLPPTKALVNFLDNHDVPRFLYDAKDPRVLRNALLFLMTEDGIPCLYYGTEQEFAGGNDPANREDLWKTGYDTSGETFRWVARLTRIRRTYPALMKGDVDIRWDTPRTGAEEDAGVLAFERRGGDAAAQASDPYVLVVLNTNVDHPSRTAFEGAVMTVSRAPGDALVDVLAGTRHVVGQNGELDLTVPATSGVILVPEAQLVPGL